MSRFVAGNNGITLESVMKINIVIGCLLLLSAFALGQLKDQQKLDDIGKAISQPPATSLLGFLTSDKLEMHHTFHSSFMSFGGGQSQLTNAYINSLLYRFDAPLLLRINLGLMNTPYSSLQTTPGIDLKQTQIFGDVQLEYQPSDKTRLILGVSKMPAYSGYRGMGLYPSGQWDR